MSRRRRTRRQAKLVRPGRFSDPHGQWLDDSKQKGILETADELLTWREWQDIFHFETPIGTYEEVVYFLPVALRYMLNNADDSIECSGCIVDFVSHNVERLDKGGLLDVVTGMLTQCLQTWMSSFEVRAVRGTPEHMNVVRSQAVWTLVEALVRSEACRSIAVQAAQKVATSHCDWVAAAWYMELAREYHDVSHGWSVAVASGGIEQVTQHIMDMAISRSPGVAEEELKRRLPPWEPSVLKCEPLRRVLIDRSVQERHMQYLRTVGVCEENPAYWEALCADLDL